MLLYCQILLVWMSGWLDFLKIYVFQPPTKAVVGSHAFFLWVIIKVNHFAFNNNPVFWPDTTCLFRWLAGLAEIKAISASNDTWGWAQVIFWCLLIIFNNIAFYEDAVLWPETTCLDGWVGGWIFWKYSHLSPQLKLGLGLGLSLAKGLGQEVQPKDN